LAGHCPNAARSIILRVRARCDDNPTAYEIHIGLKSSTSPERISPERDAQWGSFGNADGVSMTGLSDGLTATDLTLWRGPNCLFEDLSFKVAAGSLLLLRGPNGSGKTTLLRVLCGITRPETGHVEWRGESIEKNRQAYGAALAYFGHTNGLKADLTVMQNLAFAAQLYGQSGEQISDLLNALNLTVCAELETRYLSAGQKRRTALARVLMSQASLWLLDEPVTNLDAAGREYVINRLAAHVAEGGIVVAATHEDIHLEDKVRNEIQLGDDW
jgi:heme exporter protein A